MNVSDILDNVIDLSIGRDEADDEERATFLNYLNMASEELYRLTAPFDEQRSQTHIQQNFDESVNIELKDSEGDEIDILAVSKVRSKQFEKFSQVSFALLQEKKFMGEAYTPIFCVRKNVFTLYSNGTKPYDVFMAYTPIFIDFTGDEEEGDIPFRIEWHPLLVYGTLYYIYQDMDGFKSSVKESIAASEWKSGIEKYARSLFNSSPDGYIPYTRV